MQKQIILMFLAVSQAFAISENWETTLADIEYLLNTKERPAAAKPYSRETWQPAYDRLIKMTNFEGETPPRRVREVSRVIAHYSRLVFDAPDMHQNTLADITNHLKLAIAYMLIDGAPMIIVKKGIAIRPGTPFVEGHIFAIKPDRAWWMDRQGQEHVIVFGEWRPEGIVFDPAQTTAMLANGLDRTIIETLRWSLDYSVNCNFLGTTIKGAFYAKNAEDLMFKLINRRGLRFIRDGDVALINAPHIDAEKQAAEISVARMDTLKMKLFRKLNDEKDPCNWGTIQVDIDPNLVLTRQEVEGIPFDAAWREILDETVGKYGYSCLLTWSGQFFIRPYDWIEGLKTNSVESKLEWIRKKLDNQSDKMNADTQAAATALLELVAMDYDLAMAFDAMINTADAFPEKQRNCEKSFEKVWAAFAQRVEREPEKKHRVRMLLAQMTNGLQHIAPEIYRKFKGVIDQP